MNRERERVLQQGGGVGWVSRREVVGFLKYLLHFGESIESRVDSFQWNSIYSGGRPDSYCAFLEWWDKHFSVGIGVYPMQRRLWMKIDARRMITADLSAFLRKKALQDMHVITSKFMPRATSPQIRQISVDRKTRFEGIFCSCTVDIVQVEMSAKRIIWKCFL